MAFAYTHSLTRKTYIAGARQPSLELVAPDGERLGAYAGPFEGYFVSFAPRGARLNRAGNHYQVAVAAPGEGRVAFLIRAFRFRRMEEGREPQVWKVSWSRGEGGLLAVAAPGFEFEVQNYNRPWRRFRVEPDGSLLEIVQSEEVID